jgi:prepilin-type N-terminal cleavage/methylation domain-containing protein
VGFFQRRHSRLAFSLIELVSAMTIMSVLAGLTVPAMKGLNGANALDTGTRKFADLLYLARSEAIARHTVVRFAVVREWPGQPEANRRKVGLWAWDVEAQSYLALTAWEELPVGLALESQLPPYVRTASYALDDGAAVRGDCVLASEFANKAGFEVSSGAAMINADFIEFMPSGTVRIPGGSARQAIFVLTQGFTNAAGSLTYISRAGSQPTNWAQVNIDTLTGRARIYQP